MKILTTLCCAAFALCSAIYAQTPAHHTMVHFNTSVIGGDTKPPAGDCDIQVMRGSSHSIILGLRSPGAPAIAAVARHLSEGDTDAEANTGVVLSRRCADLHLSRILFAYRTVFQLNNAE